MRHRCQAAPGRVAATAAVRPACASEVTSFLHAQHLPVAVGVHAGGGDQRVHGHDPSALADFEHERVGGDERERAGVRQGAGAELLNVRVEFPGHVGDLALGQARDAQRLHELVHPAGRDPEQVAGRDHAGQRPLGALAPLQQPFGEVGALPQLRDLHLERAGAGVELAGTVAVAPVHALRAGLPVRGAAHGVGLGRHQRVHERLQQLAQQIRRRLGELFLQQARRVDTSSDGHRRVPFLESVVRDHSKDHAVAVATPGDTLTALPIHHFAGGH